MIEKAGSVEIKVGVVAFLGILLLVLGITVGKGLEVTSTREVVKFRFPSSGGITISSPIVVNGVARGEVTGVTNDNQSVIVTGLLSNPSDIRTDAKAVIKILEITGGKKIEINPGQSTDKFDLNKEIPGKTAADIADLVAIIGDISDEGILLIKRMDTLAAGANELLGDDKFINNVKMAASNANSLLSNADMLLAQNYASINSSLKSIEILTADLKAAIKKYDPEIGIIIDKLKYTLDDTRELVSKADSVAVQASNLIFNLNEIAVDIKDGEGLLSSILYDAKFREQVDKLVEDLGNFVSMISEYGVNINMRIGTRP